MAHNKRIQTNTWSQIDFELSNVASHPNENPLGLHITDNMYNNVRNPEGARKVTQYMRNKAQVQNSRRPTHIVGIGKTSTPTTQYGMKTNSHLFMQANLDKVQIIIDMMANHTCRCYSPKNIPTLCAMATRNFTWLDNILASSSLWEHVLECKTSPETCQQEQITYLSSTTLNMSPGRQEEVPKLNFKLTNWPKLPKELTKDLRVLTHNMQFWNKKWVLQKTQLTDTSNHRYNRIDSCKVQTIPIHKVMVVKRTITEVKWKYEN